MKRDAFSLLEVMIATAILAASAMVLSSLIGLGSKFGNRAEERTIALAQAESLLDEFIAGLGNNASGNNQQNELTGELPGPPPRSFRISATPFNFGNANAYQGPSNQGGSQNGPTQRGLLRVTVEVFETAGVSVGTEAKSLIELSRLIRQPQMASGSPSNEMSDGAQPDGIQSSGIQSDAAQAATQDATQGVASSTQGNFP